MQKALSPMAKHQSLSEPLAREVISRHATSDAALGTLATSISLSPEPESGLLPSPTTSVRRSIWRTDNAKSLPASERVIPTETAVAFTYDGTSYAVMMATPQDLEDFAIGFSITEGIVRDASEIESLEIIPDEIGIELRMRLVKDRAAFFHERRRFMAGPTGCGLCGIESLEEAMRSLPEVSSVHQYTPEEIMAALNAIAPLQHINHETRAVHAAAFWQRGRGVVALREDVGRHNALDKVGGQLSRLDTNARDGVLVVTSRLSVEMIQKAAMLSLPVVVAVSAPTALALKTAEKAKITVIGIARSDGFEIFTHPSRIRE